MLNGFVSNSDPSVFDYGARLQKLVPRPGQRRKTVAPLVLHIIKREYMKYGVNVTLEGNFSWSGVTALRMTERRVQEGS